MTQHYTEFTFEGHTVQIVINESGVWLNLPDYVEAVGGARSSASERIKKQQDFYSVETETFSHPGSRPNTYVNLSEANRLIFRIINQREASKRLNRQLIAHFQESKQQDPTTSLDVEIDPRFAVVEESDLQEMEELEELEEVAEEEESEFPESPGEPIKLIKEPETVPFDIPNYIESMDGLSKRIEALGRALDERTGIILHMERRIEYLEQKQSLPNNNNNVADIISKLVVNLAVAANKPQ